MIPEGPIRVCTTGLTREYLWGQLGFHIFHLPPQHEGFQDLVQPVESKIWESRTYILGAQNTSSVHLTSPATAGSQITLPFHNEGDLIFTPPAWILRVKQGMQSSRPVDDHHPFLRLQPLLLLPRPCRLTKGVTEPLSKRVLVVKHLRTMTAADLWTQNVAC